MMTEAVRRKLLNPVNMLRNWLLVYLGNFTGAVLVAGLLFLSGLFVSGKGQVATAIIKTAVDKAKLGGLEALILGIFCNWLVCLAIWLASRSEKAAHKAFLLFFPIWLFVTSGYEHSVANMYYLSAGLLAVLDPPTLAASGLEPGIVKGGEPQAGCKEDPGDVGGPGEERRAQPDGEHQYAPREIAQHADSCPQKWTPQPSRIVGDEWHP